jgi:hypothetical protein
MKRGKTIINRFIIPINFSCILEKYNPLHIVENIVVFKIIMDAVEDYARRWIKREVDQDPELESL